MVATMTISVLVMLLAPKKHQREEEQGRDRRALLDDAEGERQVGVHGAQGERKEVRSLEQVVLLQLVRCKTERGLGVDEAHVEQGSVASRHR
jgi:hypothetical protein